MDVDQAMALVDFIAREYSNFYPFWNCGEQSDVIVGRFLLYFSFEISMANSDSLFDFMVVGLLPIYWMKLFSIANRLNVLFSSGSILHPKCVGYE